MHSHHVMEVSLSPYPCMVSVLSAAHLMWIVGHCQADQTSRLEENSRTDTCYFTKSPSALYN